jgi:hypothetical protein
MVSVRGLSLTKLSTAKALNDEARRIATKYRQAAGALAEGLAIEGLRDENT